MKKNNSNTVNSSKTLNNSITSNRSSSYTLPKPMGKIFYTDIETMFGTDTGVVNSKIVTAKEVLKEIISSKNTELADDMKLVLNYLRGYLEKIMDNPEILLEYQIIKNELESLKEECELLKAELKQLKNV